MRYRQKIELKNLNNLNYKRYRVSKNLNKLIQKYKRGEIDIKYII